LFLWVTSDWLRVLTEIFFFPAMPTVRSDGESIRAVNHSHSDHKVKEMETVEEISMEVAQTIENPNFEELMPGVQLNVRIQCS
jgi:hypothetical protein